MTCDEKLVDFVLQKYSEASHHETQYFLKVILVFMVGLDEAGSLLASRNFTTHTLKKCSCRSDVWCAICDGGAYICTVCNGRETDLTEESCQCRVAKQNAGIADEITR